MTEVLGGLDRGSFLAEESVVDQRAEQSVGPALTPSEAEECTRVHHNATDDVEQDPRQFPDIGENVAEIDADDNCTGDSESLCESNNSGNHTQSKENYSDGIPVNCQEGEAETETTDAQIAIAGSETESQSSCVDGNNWELSSLQTRENDINDCGSGGLSGGLPKEKTTNDTEQLLELSHPVISSGNFASKRTYVRPPCPAPRQSLKREESDKIGSVDNVGDPNTPPVNGDGNETLVEGPPHPVDSVGKEARVTSFDLESESSEFGDKIVQVEGESLSSNIDNPPCLLDQANNFPTSGAISETTPDLQEAVVESSEQETLRTQEETPHLLQITEESDPEIEMGKKSGSFGKKNSGLYLYSKDEFRESYQTKPKPKPARRFTWSHKEGGEDKPSPAKEESHIYDSPPFGLPGGSSNGRGSTGTPPSLERTASPPTSPSPSSDHPHMTVELLGSGETTSPLPSGSASINHSFVVSDSQESQQGNESAGDRTLPTLKEEENMDINSNMDGEAIMKSKPVPAPRRSLSSSSNTSFPLLTRQESLGDDEVMGGRWEDTGNTAASPLPVPSSEEMTVARESVESQEAISTLTGNIDAPESVTRPEMLVVSSTGATSPRTPRTPELSEILYITRTVDGEEELILGAAPMFANQQKLAMESATPQEQSNEGRVSRPQNALSDTAKGFKNYAYIEPVDQPVEYHRAKPGRGEKSPGMEEGRSAGGKEEKDFVEDGGQTTPLENVNVSVTNHPQTVTVNGGTPGGALTASRLPGAGGDAGGVDDDDDGGVDDAAYRLSNWMYLGTKQELSLVNGGLRTDKESNAEMGIESRESSTLKPATSIDSLETTSSEREFKNQFSSMSLRKIKREGSTLGYRKLTDITREREMVISYDENVKSFGFRIQYSKPAIVTEVDSGGAAEKAGLLVGDVVLSVNSTDVRKAPHATVVKLVQAGGKELHLLVGTNMCNSPNRDLYKPIKTGYMHKLGGQGMLKNWKRRWFVLKHDGCLYYYKTEDEVDPLGAVVLINYTLMRARDAGKQHSFKITKYRARTYYFYADTETGMNSWAKAITEAAEKKTNSDVWLDISTHNVGLPALSIKSPDCRGLLTKQGANFKNWKKRYCVLKDACMYYYTDMKQPRALGIVHFHGYKIQEMELGGKKYGFTLVPPIPELRTYYFIADNETDRKRWVASLAASIGRWIQTNEEDDFSKAENDREQEMLI